MTRARFHIRVRLTSRRRLERPVGDLYDRLVDTEAELAELQQALRWPSAA